MGQHCSASRGGQYRPVCDACGGGGKEVACARIAGKSLFLNVVSHCAWVSFHAFNDWHTPCLPRNLDISVVVIVSVIRFWKIRRLHLFRHAVGMARAGNCDDLLDAFESKRAGGSSVMMGSLICAISAAALLSVGSVVGMCPREVRSGNLVYENGHLVQESMTSSREIQAGNAVGLWEEYDDWSCSESYNCHTGEVYTRNPAAKAAAAAIGGGAGAATGGALGIAYGIESGALIGIELGPPGVVAGAA